MKNNTYIDVHILQTLPPSNINRDDTGAPKQAIYGGANRLRVSSQSWKRATRLAFAPTEEGGNAGRRTKRLPELLTEALEDRGVSTEEAHKIGSAFLPALEIKAGRKGDDSSYLLFFGTGQLARFADKIVELLNSDQVAQDTDPQEVIKLADPRKAFSSGHSLDVALFGRMVADLADLNVDASVQVAHAISTHEAEILTDYYTAVDDIVQESDDETGAGMIGVTEFNSATLYRFASLGLEQLVENLDQDRTTAVRGVEAFIRAFTLSMPSGFANSFAPRTRPALVLVTVRQDQPVNLVSAFEKPVPKNLQKGYEAASVEELANTYTEECERWGDTPVLTVASYRTLEDKKVKEAVEDSLGQSVPMEDLLSQVRQTLEGLDQ
ncbi:MAG: type I-E CRISPR-associated protein Cas7/Cse4/CasC [Actinomycetaceae bacterium]|nr:type I-E CRISPR-associated protein Cas7/Cse4/CasC [Actinomycetaceae bacterium]